MTYHNPVSGNVPAMSRRKPKGTLTALEYAEMHDALTLALDALGNGPDDVDQPNLMTCIANQRIAIKVAHGRMERLGKAQACRVLDHLPACHQPRGGQK